jgi:hypothetical protein
MLNLADLSLLLMVLAGPLCGFFAAQAHRAGIPSIILFSLGGLTVGIFLGRTSNRLAYSVLGWKRLSAGLLLLLYTAILLGSLLVVIAVPFWVAESVWSS